MVDEELVAVARDEAHQAIQKYVNALYGSPHIATDWVVTCEVIGDEHDQAMLYLLLSANMSSWKLRGMVYTAARQVAELTS